MPNPTDVLLASPSPTATVLRSASLLPEKGRGGFGVPAPCEGLQVHLPRGVGESMPHALSGDASCSWRSWGIWGLQWDIRMKRTMLDSMLPWRIPSQICIALRIHGSSGSRFERECKHPGRAYQCTFLLAAARAVERGPREWQLVSGEAAPLNDGTRAHRSGSFDVSFFRPSVAPCSAPSSLCRWGKY